MFLDPRVISKIVENTLMYPNRIIKEKKTKFTKEIVVNHVKNLQLFDRIIQINFSRKQRGAVQRFLWTCLVAPLNYKSLFNTVTL